MYNEDKKISTRNLYLCEVARFSDKKLSYFADYDKTTYFFSGIEGYILARKCIFGYYDIFTKTIYKRYNQCESNDLCIREVKPCITNRGYITYGEATEILAKRNSVFIQLNRDDNVKKRKLVKERTINR